MRSLAEKAASVANIEKDVGWTKLWNAALELGAKHKRTVPGKLVHEIIGPMDQTFRGKLVLGCRV